jgi:sec-independent protein translocase protein TatC
VDEDSNKQTPPKKRKKFGWNSPDHNPEEFRLSLVEHLEELRTRVIRSFLILLAFWAVAWQYFPGIFKFLTDRASVAINAVLIPKGQKYSEILLHIPDAFMMRFKISFYCALILAFPFIVMQVWAFIAPGLKPQEQQPLKRIGPVSLGLFIIGGFFCWLVLPAAFGWFASYLDSFPGVALTQEAGTMAMFSLKSILAFGIGFQLPLVVFVLGALNLLSSDTLIKYWRHAAIAIFFISGAITPSNDIPSMLMMAIPLTILFMVSAYAVKMVQKKKPEEHVFSNEEDDHRHYEEPKALTSVESDSDHVNS